VAGHKYRIDLEDVIHSCMQRGTTLVRTIRTLLQCRSRFLQPSLIDHPFFLNGAFEVTEDWVWLNAISRGDFRGYQGGLRADLRVSSADANDAGSEHPLFAGFRHRCSRSRDDNPICHLIALSRCIRKLVHTSRRPEGTILLNQHSDREGFRRA
jgi:hypothetical protein